MTNANCCNAVPCDPTQHICAYNVF
jgi:hypothetical protein